MKPLAEMSETQYFLPIFNQCSTSIPSENIRKPLVLRCFQGYRNGILVENGLNLKM